MFVKYLNFKSVTNTLIARFTLIIVVPITILQFIAIYLFYNRHWYHVTQYNCYFLSNEISSLISNGDYKRHPQIQQSYSNLLYTYLPNEALPNQKKINKKELAILKDVLLRNIANNIVVSKSKNNTINVSIDVNDGVLNIKIRNKAILSSTTYVFVIWIIALTLLLLTLSLIFSKNQIKSIIALANALNDYGENKKDVKYRPSGAREIKLAGIAFLKMKKRIDQYNKQRTNMLAMISHDLKTPLTRMKLQVELMENEGEKEELNYDINVMEQMIGSYLDFVRGEVGENFSSVYIDDYIKKNVSNVFSGANIILNLSCKEIKIHLKVHAFNRAINNFLDNAVKYANKIIVSTILLDCNLLIVIEDNGPGIKTCYKQQVFEPFFRCDNSRSLNKSMNVGLGMSIAQEIIKDHSGKVTLKSSKELGGLKVIVELPIDHSKLINET